jgi:YD repeat-containing protein
MEELMVVGNFKQTIFKQRYAKHVTKPGTNILALEYDLASRKGERTRTMISSSRFISFLLGG